MPSAFVGVYNAVYSYAAQSDQELSLQEGDLLYILEKSDDDDWWKAKKRSSSPDEDEPVGLVPSNYIEETKPIGKYKALYDYAQQTEEELSFQEEASLDVYDLSDPDWALVGLNGEYGFAPVTYIEKVDGAQAGSPSAPIESAQVVQPAQPVAASPKHVSFSPPEEDEEEERQARVPSPAAPPVRSPTFESRSPSSPAFRHEQVMASSPRSLGVPHSPARSSHSHTASDSGRARSRSHGHESNRRSTAISYTSDSDDSEGPGIPLRRPGEPRYGVNQARTSSPPIPPGYQTFPVQEVDSKKKRAATLGLGPGSIILLPDKSSRPKEEWAVEHLVSYNYEGKHVFLELEKPSRSLDLHAGSTDAAAALISAIGELRGARKTMELIGDLAASSPKKTSIGTVLYDFAAQGDDEVSVTVGDEVVILDDTLDEWWKVRRQVNGLEGVVPSSYIERGRSNKVVPQGIRESPGDPKARVKSQHGHENTNDGSPSGVPERRSSLAPQNRKSAPAKTKPDASQVRTWTDRTGSFKVEAQFLGCRDGKIHLHKLNGVKIAVPVSKMALRDIEYVESRTGISLDEDKPLKAIQERHKQPSPSLAAQPPQDRERKSPVRTSSITPVAQVTRKDDFDWFEFFLGCGVDVNDCQRYALNFQRDNMDPKLLESITAENMRTLGLKEGDILRITKYLDDQYGRKKRMELALENGGGAAGIFAGPDGVLKNNTRKGRPAPAIHTPDVVDPKAFAQNEKATPAATSTAPPATTVSQPSSGFDDDAWAPKPSKSELPRESQGAQSPPPTTTAAPAQPAAPVGALQDLSALTLDTPPLQPTVKAPSPSPQPQPQPVSQPMQVPAPPTSSGAFVPSMQAFSQAQTMPPNYAFQNPALSTQFTGRQRPPAPVAANNSSSSLGIAPPPARPVSAPHNFAAGINAPLTASFTGIPAGQPPFMNYNHTGQPGMPNPMGMQPTGTLQGPGFLPNNGMYQGMQNPGQQFPGQLPGGGLQQSGVQMPALQAQATGMSMSGFGMPPQSFPSVSSGLPPPLLPQRTAALPPMQPLQPQQTGPAPSIKFGVSAQKKLVPQPTGRADLSKATPENPFGF